MQIPFTRAHVLSVSLAAASFGWLGPLAGEAHALQCGQTLVLVGDSMAEVMARCGDPTTAHQRTETSTVWLDYPRPGFVGRSYSLSVQIDIWVYDFGPGRFVEELTFRDGVLVGMGPAGRRRWRRAPPTF